jgi:hypothetical protein
MIRDMMTGIEKLKKAELYDVTTQFGRVFKQICFEGFRYENEDVTLAIFSDPVSQEFFYFDDSITETVVEFAGIQYLKKFQKD